jgi:hypothetical protein
MYENTNISTGIRFGVLSVRIVEPNWAYNDFYNHAESIQWNEKIEELKEMMDSIHAFADEHGLDQKQEIEDLHQSILSDLSDHWDSSDDMMIYEDGEYTIILPGDRTEFFIKESPYITFAPQCSPCAPGAAYLADAEDGISGLPAYCLPKEFFPNEKAPYEYLMLAGAYDMLWGKIFPDEDMTQFMEYLKSTTTIPYMELKTLIMDAIQILLKGEENTDRGKFILGAVKTRIIHMKVVEGD